MKSNASVLVTQKNYPSANTDDHSDKREMHVGGGHEGKNMASDRIAHGRTPNIDFNCIQKSRTQEELVKCVQNYKHQKNENKSNQLNKRDLMCGPYICDNNQSFAADNEISCNIEQKSLKNTLACIKAKTLHNYGINRLFKENVKRNPFCGGRFGCQGKKRKIDKMLPVSVNTFDLNCFQQTNNIEEAMNCLHAYKVAKFAETTNKSDKKRNPFCGRYGCGRKRSVKRFACNRYGCSRSLIKARGASDRRRKQNVMSLHNTNDLKKLLKGPVTELRATLGYFTIPNTDELRTNKHKEPISNYENRGDESTSFTKEVPDGLNDTIKRLLVGNCGSNTDGCVVKKTKTMKKKKKIIKTKKSDSKVRKGYAKYQNIYKKMIVHMIKREPEAFISASAVIVLRPLVKSLLDKRSPKTSVFRKDISEKILPDMFQKLRSYERKENVHQHTFEYESDNPDSDSFYDLKRLVFSMFGNVCGKSKECHKKNDD